MSQRYNLFRKIKSYFCKSWSRDYLVTLQTRENVKSDAAFKINDQVLLAEKNFAPLDWKLGRKQKYTVVTTKLREV